MLVRVRLRGVWQPILQIDPGLMSLQPLAQLAVQEASDVRPVSLKLIVGHTHTGMLAVVGAGVMALYGGSYNGAQRR